MREKLNQTTTGLVALIKSKDCNLLMLGTAFLVAAGSVIYVCCLLSWGLLRGFDIMDEGYYLLLAKTPSNFPALSSYPYLLSIIPNVLASRVLDFRLAQVLAQLIGSIFLSIGYLNWLLRLQVIKTKMEIAIGIIFGSLGNLLIFAKFPFSISYNTLTGLFLFSSTGLLLAAALKSEETTTTNHKSYRILTGVAGLLCGWCMLTKFPATSAYVPCALSLIFLLYKTDRFKSILLFLTSATAAIVVFVLIFGSSAVWSAETTYQLQYPAQNNTLHSNVIKMYWENCRDIFCRLQPTLSIGLLSSFLLSFAVTKLSHKLASHKIHYSNLLLHLGLWLVAGWLLSINGFLKHNEITATVFYMLCWLLLCQLAGLALARPQAVNLSNHWQLVFIMSTVITIPFICAFGTSNPLLYQSTIYSSGVFLFLFTLAKLLSNIWQNSLPFLLTIITCSTCAVSQFYDGFVRHPYCQGDNLKKASEPAKLRNLKGLTLSKSVNDFLDQSDLILRRNGYQSGDYLLAFYNMPGLVYVMDGCCPKLGWFLPFPGYRNFNDHYISQTVIKPQQRLFLMTGWKLHEDISATFLKAGIKYPADFHLIGTVQNPITIGMIDGKPDSDYLNGTVHIYVYTPQADRSTRSILKQLAY